MTNLMGHIHISFEYHIHKSSLKIRVWQLSDLLLPPPQKSMIQSIYVRSYLTPSSDTKKYLQRTEEVRVENLEAHINVKQEQKPLTGIQHIFTPSNFKFLTPLEYTGISLDVVRDKSVQIEVYMIQKTTRKSFLIGMINIPLKKAVKKIVREKIPLIPCLNYTTPNNMRVYSTTDLDLESGELFYSSLLLKQLNGEVAPEFEGVIVQDENLIKPVHINIRHKNHITDNVEDKVQEVSDTSDDELDFSNSKLEVSEKPADIDVNKEQEVVCDKKLIKVNMDDLELNDVPLSTNHLHIPQEIRNKSVHIKKQETLVNGNKSPELKNRTKISVPVDLEIDGSDQEIENTLTDLNINSPIASRPETPVWDYYDFEYEQNSKQKKKESKTSNKCRTSDVVRSN